MLWYCGQNTSIWRRSATGNWTLERLQVDHRAQYTIDDVLQLNGPDVNCMVHTRQGLEPIGGWDETCRWLEDWDFFARCMLRFPTHVHWVPQVLVEYRQVYGSDIDGICATTAQDPVRKREHWQYLIDKWRSEPRFSATAQRLTRKHLCETAYPNQER